MRFLIDTKVISEIRKGARCDPAVAGWFDTVRAEDLRLSVLVLGEIAKGIAKARGTDPAKAAALEAWLQRTLRAYEGRVVGIDVAVAFEWGRMSAIRPLSTVDALLAATARVHGMTLVTRDETMAAELGVSVLNPWKRSVS